MSMMASQITNLTIVYSIVYSGTDQRKHQRFASLALVRGIHRWPVNSPHKGPVTPNLFPFDGAIIFVMPSHSNVYVWYITVLHAAWQDVWRLLSRAGPALDCFTLLLARHLADVSCFIGPSMPSGICMEIHTKIVQKRKKKQSRDGGNPRQPHVYL